MAMIPLKPVTGKKVSPVVDMRKQQRAVEIATKKAELEQKRAMNQQRKMNKKMPSVTGGPSVDMAIDKGLPPGVTPPGMAKGGMAKDKAQKKVGKVMKEFKEGTLHSGKGGKVVKNPKQAIAIALSEAGKAKAKPKAKPAAPKKKK